jgi:hypothetical protein
MLGEGQQPWVEADRAGQAVVVHQQRPGVVEQDLLRQAAERRNALSSPSNQHAWRSCRKARTCTRRGWPSVATNRYTRDRLLADHHALSPKSTCICLPGGVSNRIVARASAASSRRNGATARSTVRRLTLALVSDRLSN